MPYLVLDQTDPAKVVNCTMYNEVEGSIEITDGQAKIFRHLDYMQVRYIDDVLTETPEATAEWDARKNHLALHCELERLEIMTARGFLWLVKHLIQEGVIQQSNIPAKLIAYKNRIEEIEAELNQ